MDIATLTALLLACAPQVNADTAMALIAAESAGNPHAIGVVGGQLTRQPRTRAQALATAHSLQREGWDFSLGLAQINRRSLPRLGLTLESVLQPCINLGAMQTILSGCFERARRNPPTLPPVHAQHAVRKALSCYYSGNFQTGFDHGYVQKVVRLATSTTQIPTHPKETP